MMLRKRSKPAQKDQNKVHPLMQDSDSDAVTAVVPSKAKAKGSSFFSVSSIFVRFGSKGVSESDSSRSPTSPLEYKVFSSLGSAFALSPRSPSIADGPRKSWDCNNRVGLGLVDSLSDGSRSPGTESKNILISSQMKINFPSPKSLVNRVSSDRFGASSKSLPKNYGTGSRLLPCFHLDSSDPVKNQMMNREMGKTQSCSADIRGPPLFPAGSLVYLNPKSNSEGSSLKPKKSQLCSTSTPLVGVNFEKISVSLPIPVVSCHGYVDSFSASDIEMSEDYTRISTHGSNPRTTHIFGDCIIGSHTSDFPPVITATKAQEVCVSSKVSVKPLEDTLPSMSDGFLSFCHFCKKKLKDGEDIYIYRGEKAFCSCSCREQEILIDEELEKARMYCPDSPRSCCDEEFFITGMVISTD